MTQSNFWVLAKDFIFNISKVRLLSAHTVKAYKDSINCYINYLEGHLKVDRKEISFEDFNVKNLFKYQEFLVLEKKLSPATCNLRLSVLKSLLEYCSRKVNWILPYYIEAKDIRKIQDKTRTIEYFKPDQLKALLGATGTRTRTDRRNRVILILMYDCALRVEEMRNLVVADLKLDHNPPYLNILGKGNRYRSVPLMGKTVSHINLYLKEFHSQRSSQEPLFYSIRDGIKYRLSSDTLEQLIKKCNGKAKAVCQMPDNVHCHMLRKTRAIDLFNSGISLPHIQQLLGHASTGTTTGFYTFATVQTLSKELSKLSDDSKEKKLWEDESIREKLYQL